MAILPLSTVLLMRIAEEAITTRTEAVRPAAIIGPQADTQQIIAALKRLVKSGHISVVGPDTDPAVKLTPAGKLRAAKAHIRLNKRK